MPPRKSDASKAGDESTLTPVKEKAPPAAQADGVNIEDLNLPKSIVTRLAKGVLPPNTQVQGNAMLAMSKSATVFVNYLATHANDHTLAANRKTISPQDVLKALDDIEFPEFKERLEAELAKFNDIQTDKRNAYRKKVAAAAAASTANPSTSDDPSAQLPSDPNNPTSSTGPSESAMSNTLGQNPGSAPGSGANNATTILSSSASTNNHPLQAAQGNGNGTQPPTKKQRMEPGDLEDSMLVDAMIEQEEAEAAEEIEDEEEVEEEEEELEEEEEEEEDGDETLEAEELENGNGGGLNGAASRRGGTHGVDEALDNGEDSD